MTRKIGTADKAHMSTVKGEILQPGVAAIRYQQKGFLAAQVHRNAVRTIELPRFLPFSAERVNIIALAVVLVDITGPIAISNINIAIRRKWRDWSDYI